MDSYFTLFMSFGSATCLGGAALLLVILFVIDLKHYLLPDKYVFPFGVLGLVFHATHGFALLSPEQAVLGAVLGGGMLYVVRYLGTLYYKQEAMGLGDVKLLTAVGLWLGPDATMIAVIAGATAGLVHGILVGITRAIKTKDGFSIKRLVIPAGPGFIIGIVGAFVYVYGPVLGVYGP